MAITLIVNPTAANPNTLKLYRSGIPFARSNDYPTRIRQPGSGVPGNPASGNPGFLNLIVATGESDDAIKNDPFLLRLKDHKIFVLRRRFIDNKLYIWCIVKKKGPGGPGFEIDETDERVSDVFTGNLVLTVETEDETIDSTELSVVVVDA